MKITGKYEYLDFRKCIDGFYHEEVVFYKRSSRNENTKWYALFSMADRQDDYLTQVRDGYATYVAGLTQVVLCPRLLVGGKAWAQCHTL